MTRLRPLLFTLFVVLLAAGCRSAEVLPTPAAMLPATQIPAPTPTLAINSSPTLEPPTAAPTVTATPTGSLPTPEITPPLPTQTPEPTPCAEPGRIEHGSLESAVAGEPMRYRVYLPPCYGIDGKAHPTLYMFGGNIHDDAIWDMLGLDEAAEAAIVAGDIPALLIVMPDNGWLANTTTSGPRSYEGFVLDELIPHIESAYCAWPEANGRAVGGLSRGGYWSLMMAFRRPDMFRSAAAHSPALIDSHAGPDSDPVQTGATNDLGALRIWVDIGRRDPYLIEARPLHDALTATGVPHEWHVNEGTHDEAYWRANLLSYLTWYSDGWPVEPATLPDCDL